MRSRSRVLTVAAVATLLAGLLLAWLLPVLITGLTARPGDFVDSLVLGCTLAATVATGWSWVLVLLVLLDELRGRVARRRGVPAGVRRLVLVACGATLVGGLALPAHADRPGPPSGGPQGAATTTALLVGLPLPDRTTRTSEWLGSVAGSAEREAGPEQASPDVIVVEPGDTLWALARDTLPDGATTDEVDRRWPEIYRANRDAVGADPDLIRPGQRLQLPGDLHL